MKETEISLEEILKAAFEQSHTPYIITDKDGKIIYVNDALIKISGYSKEELINNDPSLFKSGKHNKQFYQKMWETINSGKPYQTRITNKRKDGSEYQVMLTIQPVKINGEIKYFVAREEDISDLIKLENKLIETQKLESVAIMTGELAHNFNNLLTVIIGSTEMIMEKLPQDSVEYKLAQELLKSTKEQAKLIKELLVFARTSVEEHNRHLVELNTYLNNLKDFIQTQISSRIILKYELSSEPLHVKIDEQLMQQAILNITSNAKDAIRINGEIIVKTYRCVCDNELKEPYHTGTYAVIEILDNGEGIPQNVINHIFEPFFTTKEKGKGTGLGLSSTYGIVKNHGGYIYASNRTDTHGAVFRIYLPLQSNS